MTVSEDGTWSFDVSSLKLTNGSYPIEVKVISSDGTGHNTATTTLVVIAAIINNVNSVAINASSITGLTNTDSTIVLTINGTSHDVTVSEDGTWSFDVSSLKLTNGSYPIEVKVISSDGTRHNTTIATLVTTDMTSYNTAITAVTESDYTITSWTTYQLVVTANTVTNQNTQAEVNAATLAITTAQGSLVTNVSVLVAAKTAAHLALVDALATYTQGNYTTDNWTTLTGLKTAGDVAIDIATDSAGVTLAQTTAINGMAGIVKIAPPSGGGGSGGAVVLLSLNNGGHVLNASTEPVGKVLGVEKFIFTLLLKKGSTGNEVLELQKFLNNANYNVGTADGKFGAKTKASVIKLQIANKLKADGVVGVATRAFLNK